MVTRVLIIDDSRLIREAIAKILLDCGLKKSVIASVENGNDAIDYLDLSPADIVICSDNLSDMSLADLFSQINKQTTLDSLATIVIESSTNGQLTNLGFLNKRQHRLIKRPFSKHALVDALSALTQDPIFNVSDSLGKQPSYQAKELKPYQQPTILIVDDESSNIDVAAGLLRGIYRIVAAKNGKQALHIINSQYKNIDLVLLDIMMPEMDGYQVCKAIKSNNKSQDIPVIFLTAKAEVADITKGFSLGAVDYITKPIQGEILLARVQTHITLRQHQAQLADKIEALQLTAKLKEDIENISRHDLKGPLASILFHAEKIDDKNVASAIKSTVNNVISMINRSLELYKIEQGTYNLSPVKTDLTPLVLDAIHGVSGDSTAKNIHFNTSGLGQAHFASAEPLLCISIFNNLIKNAIEAAPLDSEIELELKETGNNIEFSCQNDGAIPKELRNNLFDKYATGDNKKGSGLGTYSAKLTVEAQRGSIVFDIINEKATRFTIKLPKHT